MSHTINFVCWWHPYSSSWPGMPLFTITNRLFTFRKLVFWSLFAITSTLYTFMICVIFFVVVLSMIAVLFQYDSVWVCLCVLVFERHFNNIKHINLICHMLNIHMMCIFCVRSRTNKQINVRHCIQNNDYILLLSLWIYWSPHRISITWPSLCLIQIRNTVRAKLFSLSALDNTA